MLNPRKLFQFTILGLFIQTIFQGVLVEVGVDAGTGSRDSLAYGLFQTSQLTLSTVSVLLFLSLRFTPERWNHEKSATAGMLFSFMAILMKRDQDVLMTALGDNAPDSAVSHMASSVYTSIYEAVVLGIIATQVPKELFSRGRYHVQHQAHLLAPHIVPEPDEALLGHVPRAA